MGVAMEDEREGVALKGSVEEEGTVRGWDVEEEAGWETAVLLEAEVTAAETTPVGRSLRAQ